jgi:DNA polymerase III subunit gamma/tau
MPALYRSYRPKRFDEVINQEHVVTTLKNSIASGNFAHAYLFTGPRGTGKTSIARILARAVNCEKLKDGEPCNECPICLSFVNGYGLDLVEIDAASNTGVENIREIIEHLKFTPTSAKYKVFIIDEVHMLSKGAFNALLKTLEEPPKHAIFILATTEIHKVPATVISRTQRFDFNRITRELMAGHIKSIAEKEKIKIDIQSIDLVAGAAEGSMRDALSILDKLSSVGNIDAESTEKLLGLTNFRISQEFLQLLLSKDSVKVISYLENLFSAGLDPVQFNKDFLEYLRKILLLKMGASEFVAMDKEQSTLMQQQADEIEANDLLYIIRLFLKANKDFQISPNIELPLEIAAAEAVLYKQPKVAGKPLEPSKPAPSQVSAKREVKSEPVEKIATEEFPARAAISPDTQIISEERVRAEWSEILSKVKLTGSSLFTLLKNAQLKSVDSNQIHLVFGFKFHKDSLDQAKNRDALIKIMNEHFGSKFTLQISFEKSEKSGSEDAGNVLMDVFGENLA